MRDSDRSVRSLILAGGLALVVVGAGVLVWPTVYRYDRMRVGSLDIPVRMHRLTGKTEALYPSGWRAVGNYDAATQEAKDLSSDELAKLDGEAHLTDYGWIKAQIYNGTARSVGEVTVELLVRDKRGQVVLQRAYALTSARGHLLSSSEYIAGLGFTLQKGQTWDWRILSAKAR